MEQRNDEIVDISPTLEKFFGCSGKMLKPSIATVEMVLKQIPADKLISTDLLRQVLARQFQVQVTCPFDTKMALHAIAADESKKVPYWRVVKKNGELIAKFPGGVDGHAALLAKDGFSVDTLARVPKVHKLKDCLLDPAHITFGD